MFPAYYSEPGPGPSEGKSSDCTTIDKDGEILTKEGLREKNFRQWNSAKRGLEEEKKEKEKIKESLVIKRLVYYGADDDSDDNGGVSVPLPEQFHRSADEVFQIENPNTKKKSVEKERKKERSKRGREANEKQFSSSDEDRGKKKKKHKHRRRRNSSSSSSGRSSSPRLKKKTNNQIAKIKWSHLTPKEFEYIRDSTFNTWIVTSRQYDPQNYSLGFPVAEKIFYKRKTGSLLGMESKKMHELFPDENVSKKKAPEKPFYLKLLRAVKHAPQETRFRRMDWDTISSSGFVKLSQESLTTMEYDEQQLEKKIKQEKIRKELHEQNIIDADCSVINTISDLETRGQVLNTRLSVEPNNIQLWLSLLDLQDEIYESRKNYELNDSKQAFLERKEEILNKAIEKNRRAVLFPLMRIEVLVSMHKSVDVVLSELKKIAHSFPHEPLAWNRYLDYVQYNNNVYSYDRMDSAFTQCLEKVRGLVEGTLQSHVRFIENIQEFRRYQLDVYIRYQKWLLASGFLPKVIANIQATFELNFGFTQEVRLKKLNIRLAELKSFWDLKIPRIGDITSRGASNEILRYRDMSEDMRRKVELGEYDVLMFDMKRTVENTLERCDRSLAENWVEFERKAMQVDGRVKRSSLETYVDEIKEELEILNLWGPVEYDELKVYVHPRIEETFDFVQPLLEILGARFILTNGCYSTTEDLIENWRPFGVFQGNNVQNFPKIQTHTEQFCLEFCIRVIHFLLKNEYKYNDDTNKDKEKIYQLFSAAILTKAKMMELQYGDNLIKKLDAKKLVELLKGSVEPFNSILEENAILRVPLLLIAVEKFVEWHKKAVKKLEAEQEEIERCTQKQIFTDLYVDEEDVKKVEMKIPKALVKFLIHCRPESEIDKPVSKFGRCFKLVDAQIQLFSLFNNVRMITRRHGESINLLLAGEFITKPADQINSETIVEELKQMILQFRLVVAEQEYKEENGILPSTSVITLPRASVICIGLLVVHAFTNLKIGDGDISVISGLSNLIIDHITKSSSDPTAFWFPFNNGSQARDAKFLLDTFLFYLSETKERKMIYSKYYRNMIQRAQQYMPCDASYAKTYLDEVVTSTVQKIHVEKILSGVKNEMKMLSRRKFDCRFERTRLMISMASMYCQLRLSSNTSEKVSSALLLKKCRQEASEMADPAIWRVAIALAAETRDEKVLDEIHVMATGQCAWARNVHIDWVAGAPTENRLENAMMLVMEVSRNAPHTLFVDDVDVLRTHFEVAQERLNSRDSVLDPF